MNIPLTQRLTQIGSQLRSRRLAMGLTQAEAAGRAGVAYRTWRRMEKDASASIEDMVRAAIALRCEQAMTLLFPEPAASSMDELLARQKAAQKASGGMMQGKRPKRAKA